MDQLLWGLQITALGMGLVFALLALLWGLLTLVLRLDKSPPASADAAATAAATEPAPMAATAVADGDAATPGGLAPSAASAPEGELLAAIVMATLAHRAVRRREAAPAMRSYWPGSLLYASRWLGAGRARQNQTWQRRGR